MPGGIFPAGRGGLRGWRLLSTDKGQVHTALRFFSLLKDTAVFENTRVIKVKDGVPCEVETNCGVLHAPDVISATHTPLGKCCTVTIRDLLMFAGISILQTALAPSMSFILAVRIEQSVPAGLYYDTADPYRYLRRLDANNPNIIIVGGCDKKVHSTYNNLLTCTCRQGQAVPRIVSALRDSVVECTAVQLTRWSSVRGYRSGERACVDCYRFLWRWPLIRHRLC